MSISRIFANFVAVVGGTMVAIRHAKDGALPPAWGEAPKIPVARPQGSVPTLKMPTARGWKPGEAPVAAPGLKVNAFAAGLQHPRWIEVLPSGDVLVAEALGQAGAVRTIFDYAMLTTMRRAAAVGVSPNRITLLRDKDGDGTAEIAEPFLEKLNQPFGMALVGETFYVGNTDGLLAFPYSAGTGRVTGPGRKLATFKPGGHWTRSILPSRDGSKLYVGVGSLSNIGESGMEAEVGRAAVYEVDPVAGTSRIFASGLRNAVGLAWEPQTGALWTVVNERDGLGDETPPDYLTSVVDGGFYGWPYCYWGQTVDDRVPQDRDAVARALTPDYALGGHTASLGLCWHPAGTLPGYPDGMVIGQHGSWNRSKLSGYKVVFVPFENGRPSGPPRDILTGFLAPDERHSYGRPVGVAIARDGALLVADDVGDVIWRVKGA
ncbi:PQQ-dependent sugar dehydrogenase [Labrys wisconsinensis]|uniref:Glucose/arabinose dehydrogenase n=1 Tax=Labrys wisconsinensis TaxID=425677 RepID=A0ABU0JA12_9HYPH|nr:sorbosone dehydrogenase family protein [Labrys wisconsinensis]MDQ0470027.1 glucose/arabinose dehydrogenase [Labrys wisconsinensis]